MKKSIRITNSHLKHGFFRFSTFDASKDYYKLLNVNSASTKQQIKTNYYTLAKRYHPDLNKGLEEKFKQINEAYEVELYFQMCEVLSEDSKKREYDEIRSQQSQQSQQSSGPQYKYSQQSEYSQSHQRSRKNPKEKHRWEDKIQQQQSQSIFKQYNTKMSEVSQNIIIILEIVARLVHIIMKLKTFWHTFVNKTK